MTRGEAVLFLARVFAHDALAFGVTATDDADGWGSALDDALWTLSPTTVDVSAATVADADARTFRALLKVYGARHLLQAAAVKVNVSVADVGLSKSYSDMFKHLKILLEGYEKDSLVIALVGAVPQMVMGRMNLDFLEPSALEFG